MVVEAASPDDAMERCHLRLLVLAATTALFKGLDRLYSDGLIRLCEPRRAWGPIGGPRSVSTRRPPGRRLIGHAASRRSRTVWRESLCTSTLWMASSQPSATSLDDEERAALRRELGAEADAGETEHVAPVLAEPRQRP